MGIFLLFPEYLRLRIFYQISSYLQNKKNQNMDTPSSKRIKVVTVKTKKDMQKPLSRINEDPEHYRTMFSGPAMYTRI